MVLLGLGVHLLHDRHHQHGRLLALTQQAAVAREAIVALERESEAVARALRSHEAMVSEAAAAAPPVDAPGSSDAAAAAWERNVAALRRVVARNPQWTIPEIELLSPEEFVVFARELPLDTEEGRRKALADLRALAKRKLAPILQNAAYDYAQANGGRLPAESRELARYLETPVPAAALERYAVVAGASYTTDDSKVSSQWLLYERAPVDEREDSRQVIGNAALRQLVTDAEVYLFARALAAHAAAHSGRPPAQAADLAPHLEVPLDAAVLERYFAGWKSSPADLGLVRSNGTNSMRRPSLRGGPGDRR